MALGVRGVGSERCDDGREMFPILEVPWTASVSISGHRKCERDDMCPPIDVMVKSCWMMLW